MGSGPGIANQDGLELGPDLGPGQWTGCPRRSRSTPPFSLLHFLDCLGLQANKWKSRLETYLWELGCETRFKQANQHRDATNWFKTSSWSRVKLKVGSYGRHLCLQMVAEQAGLLQLS